MRVYHFVNREYGLQNLRKRRLKIATINDLNDPFELLGPSSTRRDFRQSFASWKNEINDRYGMLCFSRSWKNPVQWSHYAERHRGLCLGFDVPDDCLTPVTYLSKRFEPDMRKLFGDQTESQAEMLKILSTKFSHWRYENEMRCFLRLKDRDRSTRLYFASFSSKLRLREIIVGPLSAISRAELIDAVGVGIAKLNVSKARLAFRSFRVVRQRNAGLWD